MTGSYDKLWLVQTKECFLFGWNLIDFRARRSRLVRSNNVFLCDKGCKEVKIKDGMSRRKTRDPLFFFYSWCVTNSVWVMTANLWSTKLVYWLLLVWRAANDKEFSRFTVIVQAWLELRNIIIRRFMNTFFSFSFYSVLDDSYKKIRYTVNLVKSNHIPSKWFFYGNREPKKISIQGDSTEWEVTK